MEEGVKEEVGPAGCRPVAVGRGGETGLVGLEM